MSQGSDGIREFSSAASPEKRLALLMYMESFVETLTATNEVPIAADNPPITCSHCGSTDQEYICRGEWICGDCGERWNERAIEEPS